MNNKIIPLVSLLALTFSMNCHAEIYKWTDNKGQVHYTATPPTQKKVKAQEIEDKILMSAGKFDPSTVSENKETTADKEEDAEESSTKTGANSKPTKQLIDFCKGQRKSLKLLKSSQNITWKRLGKETKLTAAQRKAKIKETKSSITKDCKGI